MPICDGATCNRQIPWRVTASALQMTAGNVAFSVDGIYDCLKAELTAAKCWNLAVIKRPVVFKNLCTTCWNAQAAKWGDAATYATARAKTTAEAIYFQVLREDFWAPGSTPKTITFSKQGILSCAVHELMHYWSHDSTGLQAYNRTANVDWDEAVADILGYQTYKRFFHGKPGFASYVTPYNKYCVAFDKIKVAFGNKLPTYIRVPGDRSKLPPVVGDYITAKHGAGIAQALIKEPAGRMVVDCVREYLFTWFFLGPKYPVNDGRASVNIDRYLDTDHLKTMFVPSVAFPGYDGYNSDHAI